MSTGIERIPVVLRTEIVGNWFETYRWIPFFGGFVTFTTAFFAGANGLPIPFSTCVGSGALTFLQATLSACIVSIPGTMLSSNSKLDALFSDFIKERQPDEGFLMWSLVVVLMTTSIWLALATYLEFPVSSHQSIQGSLLGTILVTAGFHSLPLWNKDKNQNVFVKALLLIQWQWAIAPVIAFVIAFCSFALLKIAVFRKENAEKKILIFLPFYYGISVGLFSLFAMYQVISYIIVGVKAWETVLFVTMAASISALLSLIFVVPLVRQRTERIAVTTINKTINSSTGKLDQPLSRKSGDVGEERFEDALKDYLEMRVLDTVYEEEEEKICESPAKFGDSGQFPAESTSSMASSQSAPLRQLLASTPNRLVQSSGFQKTRGSGSFCKFISALKKPTISTSLEFDRRTLVRHALSEKFDEKMEDLFSFPQVLAACIFVLVQCANEIAIVASPMGVVLYIFRHRTRYAGNEEDVGHIHAALWIRMIGGVSASIGFLLCGRRLTQSLGGKLTYISNSRGLISQLSAVATMIMVTRMKLPVSCTHALFGSILGVGVADDPRNVNWNLLLKFLCGWIGSIVFCCGVASAIYSFTVYSPAYVVP